MPNIYLYVLQSSCSTVDDERVLMENMKEQHRRAQYDGLIQPILNAVNNANIEIDLFSSKIFLQNFSANLWNHFSVASQMAAGVCLISIFERTRTVKSGKCNSQNPSKHSLLCKVRLRLMYNKLSAWGVIDSLKQHFSKQGQKWPKAEFTLVQLMTACCSVKGDVTLRTQAEGYTLTMHR